MNPRGWLRYHRGRLLLFHTEITEVLTESTEKKGILSASSVILFPCPPCETLLSLEVTGNQGRR